MPPRLLVIAKAPVAGHSKTRLCPPCTPAQAAKLAEAALADTLQAVLDTECRGRTLVLDGEPGDWMPDGFDVFPQVDGDFGERLAGAFSHDAGPTLLIGMDTPQVNPETLDQALAQLSNGGDDAVLGMCPDGGYWAIGMNSPHPGAFTGVPMSVEGTGEFQLKRLREVGMSVGALSELRDVDYFDDARLVVEEMKAEGREDGQFTRTFKSMEAILCPR